MKKTLTPPNSTQVPNVILDEWMPILKPTEFCVLMVIVRQTFGWIEDRETGRRKEKDWISHSQLEIKTGKDTDALGMAIRKLRIDYDIIEAYTQEGKLITTPKLSNYTRVFYRIKTTSLNQAPAKPIKSVSSPNRKNRFGQTDKIGMTKETLYKRNSPLSPPASGGVKPPVGDPAPPTDWKPVQKGNEHIYYPNMPMAYSNKPFDPSDFKGLTEDELWEIGSKLELHKARVRKQYRSIIHMCETGDLARYVSHLQKADTYVVVEMWLRRQLKEGKIQKWSEAEKNDMAKESPAYKAKMAEVDKIFREKNGLPPIT